MKDKFIHQESGDKVYVDGYEETFDVTIYF